VSNPKGEWLDVRKHRPEGSMILWRYPGGKQWRLSLAYRTVRGHYLDCGGMAGGRIENMTHFMEIPA